MQVWKLIIGFLFIILVSSLVIEEASSLTFESISKPSNPIVEVSPTIVGIEVKGNETSGEQEILNVVFSRIGDSLLEEKIMGDVKAIYALGYFADVSVTFESVSEGSKVTFIVAENPTINDIMVMGNTVIATQEILDLVKTKKDQILNFKNLQKDIAKINDLYKDKGYSLARVVDVDTDKTSNTLQIKIVEGFVEAISLTGNQTTLDHVILRELNTHAGQVFNEDVFKKDLHRLFNLGFFSEVTPKFEAGSTADKVAIVLKIKERRTSTINFGGGYGEREGWFGFTDLSINNLWGTGRGLMVRGQAGQQLSTYQFKYSDPWFMPEKFGKRTSTTFRIWQTVGRDIYLTQQDAIYNGGDISVSKPWIGDFKTAWTFGTENAYPYQTSTFEAYSSRSIGFTLSYDTRDFWLNPTEGRYYSFNVKRGWKYTTVGTNFFKLGMDLNHYSPIVEKQQILASHIGAGIGFEDIPIGEKYWAGGANTIRGYYPSQARTGKRKFLFNIEYRLNFSDMFQGVFFYDWGNAWDTGAPDPADFISGWGPGVRINTPLGPIRLDYGVPGNGSFSEGIMHFSIGQAF